MLKLKSDEMKMILFEDASKPWITLKKDEKNCV